MKFLSFSDLMVRLTEKEASFEKKRNSWVLWCMLSFRFQQNILIVIATRKLKVLTSVTKEVTSLWIFVPTPGTHILVLLSESTFYCLMRLKLGHQLKAHGTTTLLNQTDRVC